MKKLSLFLLSIGVLSTLSAQNWAPMAAGLLPNNVVVFSISAVGDKVVWATASEEYYQAPIPNTHRPRVLRTTDGGQTWAVTELLEAPGTISFQIVGVDALTAWITTQDYGGGGGRALYKTTDGGLTWAKQLDDVSGGVALNRFSDGQHWLAHNRQHIGQSADNGVTWTNTTITGYNTNESQLLTSGANMSTTVGDTLWNGTDGGRIVRFINYGQTVEYFSTPLGTATTISSVAFQDHLNGLCNSQNAVGNHRIARSTNGGATWAALTKQPGNATDWNLTAVPGAPGFYVLCSSYLSSQDQVAITTNFGDSWTVENLNQSLNAISFSSPGAGWIGGGRITSATQPAMFKYTGAPLGAKEQVPELPGFTVSPNPASDVIRFDFDGYAEAKTVSVTLSDAQGRGVLRMENLRTGMVDVSRLPAGLYFLTVNTEAGTAVQKVVIE